MFTNAVVYEHSPRNDDNKCQQAFFAPFALQSNHTDQTGAMVAYPATPAPIASIPSSAAPSRTNQLANFVPRYTTVGYSVPPITPQGSGVPRE